MCLLCLHVVVEQKWWMGRSCNLPQSGPPGWSVWACVSVEQQHSHRALLLLHQNATLSWPRVLDHWRKEQLEELVVTTDEFSNLFQLSPGFHFWKVETFKILKSRGENSYRGWKNISTWLKWKFGIILSALFPPLQPGHYGVLKWTQFFHLSPFLSIAKMLLWI